MNATNGTLIQTTITVATKKNDSGSQQPRVALVVGAELGEQVQLMTPYCVSKSHCQTVSEATTGIAQASSSPLCSRSRIGFGHLPHQQRERRCRCAIVSRGVDQAEDERAER